MTTFPRYLLVMTVLLAVWPSRSVVAAEDRAQQRVRIAAERREANRRFEEARRACEERFAVTTCLDEARRERRRVLDRLAADQAVLDDAQRRQRAAERLRGIQDKARQGNERSAAPPPAKKVQRVPPARQTTMPLPPVQAEARHPSVTPEEGERRRTELAHRMQEAQAHREAVEKRNAARDAQKAPAAPLPVPPPASLPLPGASSGKR
jgi:colicin import membrane protein